MAVLSVVYVVIAPNGESVGFIVIYGEAGDWLDDGVVWQSQEKLNLKLIVHDVKTNRYKLRNNKNDEGDPVMRRHKRVSLDKSLGWQRHEYKLFTDETAHRHNVDGTKTTVTRRTLNPWPILVHYFRPSSSSSSSIPAARRSSASSHVTSTNHQTSSAPSSVSSQNGTNNFNDDNQEYQRVTKRAKAGNHASRDTHHVDESDSENGSMSVSSASTLSRAMRSLQNPLFSGELAPIVNVRHYSLHSHATRMAVDADLQVELVGGDSSFHDASRHPSSTADPTHLDLSEHHSLEMIENGSMRVDSVLQLQQWAEASAENLAQTDDACLFATHYAPDSSFSDEECAVLIVLGSESLPCVNLTCFVDGIECSSAMVSMNVLRVIVPKHSPGVVPMWLIGKDAVGNVLAHSDSFPFYFLPSASDGTLSFAHAISNDYFTPDVFFKFRQTTRHLDLTGNSLTNIDFLRNFVELRELVLDHNAISHWVSFPHLPKLASLSVNHNHILQIDLFVAHLVEAGLARKLKYLSTLGNAANPSFDRLEHRYYNFRIYIISKLPNLKMLDSRDVTEAERRHSQAIAEVEQQLSPVGVMQSDSAAISVNAVPTSQAAASPPPQPPPSAATSNQDSTSSPSELPLNDLQRLSSSSSTSLTPLTPDSPNFLYASDAFMASPTLPVRSPSGGGSLFDSRHAQL